MDSAERTAERPAWLKALPFLGPAPALTAHEWRVLGVVGAATLFANYGMAILGLALPQIQRELGITEANVGAWIGVVRLGVIPAIVFTVLADTVGRRLLLLVTIVGFTLSTFLTAFVRDAQQFAALQFLARVFIAGELVLAVVVVAEEFDASARGWGIGMVGALGTLGHGVASIIFSVINALPFGWRALYVIGALPLLLLAWFQRTLSETQRFTVLRTTLAEQGGWREGLRPFRNLARMYPRRMVALSAALLPVAFMIETAMTFTSKFLQEVHHYSPGNVALLYLTVGVVAPIGNVLAGRLADRFGRKPVMIVALFGNAGALAFFYNATGVWVPPAWGVTLLTLQVVLVLFAALGSELFPTSYRSTASGVREIVATVGAAIGLWLEGQLYVLMGSHAAAITVMLAAAPIAPLVIGLWLPETATRELEDIAPEKPLGDNRR